VRSSSPYGADGMRTTRSYKNPLGQVVRVEDVAPGSPVTTFEYDPFGNTRKVIAAGSTVSMTYDAAGNTTGLTHPDKRTWTYAYNACGELERQTDAVGNQVVMEYDVLGRMTRRTDWRMNGGSLVEDNVTEWFYDATAGAGIGKLAHVRSTDGYSESYAYNEYGDLVQTVRVADATVYRSSQTYDTLGRVEVLVYPETSGTA